MVILADVDSSEKSEQVVKFGIEGAKLRSEKLILVHRIEHIQWPRILEDDIKEIDVQAGEKLLFNFAPKAIEQGVECEHSCERN
ncbi:MAG: hypothetical protein H0Z19_11875 [Archaeoglobus sp.]|uniref:hypothetical protein n=1 Tax=Archaeoglobus sp. TaxID=1872626 RepID=UPI001D8679A5|nr:hypothetical protein [Archaeoglobus sp.]MBO8181147.1 hypothetical protein [Archaeoglobus sp.]